MLVPPLTDTPFTTPLAAEEDSREMLFPLLLTVAPPVMFNPVTGVFVEESVLIVLLLMFTTGDVFALLRPMTAPPVPVEESPVMVLPVTVRGFAVFPEDPMLRPVMAPWPVIEVIVLFESVDVVPPQ